MSAAPLVPMHLSASRAYKDRGCEVPPGVLKRLRKGGCIEAVEGAKEGGAVSAPELAGPQDQPAAEGEKEAVGESSGEADKAQQLVIEAQPETAISEDAPPAAVEAPSAEALPIDPAAPPVEMAPVLPKPASEEKRPVIVPVRVRKPVEPREPAVIAKPQRPTSSPTSRPVRDARLIDTAGSAPSPQAAKFKQMRQDLGVPISTVAEHSSLMLRELVSIESGELSPRPGTEDTFWRSMQENLSKANAAWTTPHPVPSGAPIEQPSARPKVPRSDSRMF